MQRRSVHREVIAGLLFDQRDYMKRLRGNGGARDLLRQEKIALLSGAYDLGTINILRLSPVTREEFISASPNSHPEDEVMRARGVIL